MSPELHALQAMHLEVARTCASAQRKHQLKEASAHIDAAGSVLVQAAGNV